MVNPLLNFKGPPQRKDFDLVFISNLLVAQKNAGFRRPWKVCPSFFLDLDRKIKFDSITVEVLSFDVIADKSVYHLATFS